MRRGDDHGGPPAARGDGPVGAPVDPAQVARWNSLAAQYLAVATRLNLEAHRLPLNLAEEAPAVEAAYRAGRRHEPRFRYHGRVPGAAGALRRLADGCGAHPWEQLVADQCRQTADELDALATRRGDAVAAASTAAYGATGGELLARARAVLAAGGPVRDGSPRTVDAEGLARQLRDAAARAGLDGWQVHVSDRMSADASCGGGRRAAWVRQGATFTVRDARRLVVHELGGHAVRQENGAAQPVLAMGRGLGPYLATEEGVALWLERRFGLATDVDERRYCLRYVAVHESQRRSFSGLYALVREWMAPEAAYLTCVRVRRGFADQGHPGVYAKDKVYLDGATAVAEHLGRRPGDLDLLLSGKVSLAMLPEVRALAAAGLWVPPRVRPEALGVPAVA